MRKVVAGASVALVLVAGATALGHFAWHDLEVTRSLLRSDERRDHGRVEEQRDCLGDRLDQLIPDDSAVRVRMAPPAAHRIIEALLPKHRIVEGDPVAQRAWLIETSRSSELTGCLRGLRVVAP